MRVPEKPVCNIPETRLKSFSTGMVNNLLLPFQKLEKDFMFLPPNVNFRCQPPVLLSPPAGFKIPIFGIKTFLKNSKIFILVNFSALP